MQNAEWVPWLGSRRPRRRWLRGRVDAHVLCKIRKSLADSILDRFGCTLRSIQAHRDVSADSRYRANQAKCGPDRKRQGLDKGPSIPFEVKRRDYARAEQQSHAGQKESPLKTTKSPTRSRFQRLQSWGRICHEEMLTRISADRDGQPTSTSDGSRANRMTKSARSRRTVASRDRRCGHYRLVCAQPSFAHFRNAC